MKIVSTIQPGEIMLEDFMKPLGLGQYRVALALGVAPLRISQIVRGRRDITADTALRLARSLGTTPGIWLRLWVRYELEVVQQRSGRNLAAGQSAPDGTHSPALKPYAGSESQIVWAHGSPRANCNVAGRSVTQEVSRI